MTPEQKVWHRRLRPALQSIPGMVFARIESRVGTGIPDVVYGYQGIGWIENKFTEAQDRIDLSGWRRSQRIWCDTFGPAGADVFLFIGTPGPAFLVATPGVTRSTFLPLEHPNVVRIYPGKIDPESLARVLARSNGQ